MTALAIAALAPVAALFAYQIVATVFEYIWPMEY